MKVPKYLQSHPAIKLVEDAKENGAEDYKYEIVLNEGWKFTNWRSITMGFFNSVGEFKMANPQFTGDI